MKLLTTFNYIHEILDTKSKHESQSGVHNYKTLPDTATRNIKERRQHTITGLTYSTILYIIHFN